MELNLLVIRSANPSALAEFYGHLGLIFDYHKHGNSPYHYSTQLGSTVLEIYPLTKSQDRADATLRLGLSIDNFEIVIERLATLSVEFHQVPTQTEWGYQAIVEDPEGRKIELLKKQ